MPCNEYYQRHNTHCCCNFAMGFPHACHWYILLIFTLSAIANWNRTLSLAAQWIPILKKSIKEKICARRCSSDSQPFCDVTQGDDTSPQVLSAVLLAFWNYLVVVVVVVVHLANSDVVVPKEVGILFQAPSLKQHWEVGICNANWKISRCTPYTRVYPALHKLIISPRSWMRDVDVFLGLHRVFSTAVQDEK